MQWDLNIWDHIQNLYLTLKQIISIFYLFFNF